MIGVEGNEFGVDCALLDKECGWIQRSVIFPSRLANRNCNIGSIWIDFNRGMIEISRNLCKIGILGKDVEDCVEGDGGEGGFGD